MDFFVPYDQLGVANPGPWQNASPASGQRGSILNALVFPAIQNEILNVQDEAGVPRDAGNFAQLLQAIRSGKLTFFVDSGAADALAVAPRTSFANLQAGVVVTVLKSAAANATKSPTLKVGTAAAMPIVKSDGSPVAVGDLPANAFLTLRSDGTNFRIQGFARSDVSASITAQQIFNITNQAPPGSGISGSQQRTNFMPTGPASSVLSSTFTAPAAGTVTGFSILVSSTQPGFSNAIQINVNGVGIAGNADSVGGSIINVTTANVNKGDTVTVTGTVSTDQAATYNTTQRFTFTFVPS